MLWGQPGNLNKVKTFWKYATPTIKAVDNLE